VLVNNAGIGGFLDLFAADSVANFDRVISINLRGAFVCSKYFGQLMLEKGGVIINIGSTRSLQSEPNGEAYASSKGGINALTHALAISLGPKKIRVNAILPGWIDVREWQLNSPKAPELSAADHAQHPVGRVGQPQDIADACLFSVKAGFMTGQTLVLDGGMTKRMQYGE